MSWCVSCKNCGRSFRVSDGFEGMQVQCRSCGNLIKIPNEKAASDSATGVGCVAFFVGLSNGEFVGGIVFGFIAYMITYYIVYEED